jgi:hypothetical protein
MTNYLFTTPPLTTGSNVRSPGTIGPPHQPAPYACARSHMPDPSARPYSCVCCVLVTVDRRGDHRRDCLRAARHDRLDRAGGRHRLGGASERRRCVPRVESEVIHVARIEAIEAVRRSNRRAATATPAAASGCRQPAAALTLAGGALGGGAGAVGRGRARSRARIDRTSIGVVARPLRGERAGGSGGRQEAPRALERGPAALPSGWPGRGRLAPLAGGRAARTATVFGRRKRR